MKILLMTNMFPNPTSQVNGIFLLKTVQQLRSRGHEFRVIYPIPRPPFPMNLIPPWKHHFAGFPMRAETDGFPVEFPRYYSSHKLVEHRNSGKVLCFWLNNFLQWQAKDFQPDLIWAQPALPVGYAAMKISERTGVPYIITVHGADMNISVHQQGAKPVLRDVYEHAEAVVTISGRLQREVDDVAPKAKTRLIYNGLDLNQLRQISSDRCSGDSGKMDAVRIVSVSNLIETKGIRYNLEALSSVAKDFQYDIIGDGVERGKLELLAKELNIAPKVTFHGELSHDQAMAFIADSDIMSLPSYQEGFGIVYAEAMALGIPIIGVKGQGITDIIQHGRNGFLVEPQNAHNLAEILATLISDSQLRKTIGNAGRETVVKMLSWEKTAGDYNELFQSLEATR